MKKVYLTFSLTTAILAAFALLKIQNFGEEQNFQDLLTFAKWGKKHAKVYSTPNEYIYRFKIFQKNLKKIKSQNSKNSLYTTGLNKFSDMSLKEFLTKHTGLKFSKNPRNPKYLKPKNPKETEVDWRKKGVVTPVKDQGNCGGCWAFSVIASVESAYAIAGNPLSSFSEQQLIDCSTDYGNEGCYGGWVDWGLMYVKAMGVETEKDYPYLAKNADCNYSGSKVVTRIKNYFDVPEKDDKQLGLAVEKSVVSVGIDASGLFDYKSGIFDGACSAMLNHAVNIVGFGSEGKVNYWIVRNSWGPGWGEDGYFRILREDGNGKCGINITPSYASM